MNIELSDIWLDVSPCVVSVLIMTVGLVKIAKYYYKAVKAEVESGVRLKNQKKKH